MANPVWPVSLPSRVLVDGYEETLPYDGDRSAIDGLPIVQQSRSRATVRPLTCAIECTSAQVETFQTFYRTTLGFGALAFDLPFPRTGTTKAVRFVGNQPPNTTAKGHDLYHVSLQLEVLP